MEQKQCTGPCGKVKDIDQFGIRSDNKKPFGQCKECKSQYDRKHYRKNKTKRLKQSKELYRKKRKEPPPKQTKAERRAYNNQLEKNRRKTDPSFALRKDVSRLVLLALDKIGFSKNGQSFLQYLPPNWLEDLKTRLALLFEPWMNWENRRVYNPITYDQNPTWNLDHIKPQSSFYYETMDCQEFKDCWALDNLRPLNAKQNIAEHYRTEEEIQQIKKDIRNKLNNA